MKSTGCREGNQHETSPEDCLHLADLLALLSLPGYDSDGSEVQCCYENTMRSKHKPAVLLCVIMVCASCWASDCELSCSLTSTRAACHKTAHSARPHPGALQVARPHSHCGPMQSTTSNAVAWLATHDISACSHASCDSTAGFALALKGREGFVTRNGALPWLAARSPFEISRTQLRADKPATVRPQLSAVDSSS